MATSASQAGHSTEYSFSCRNIAVEIGSKLLLSIEDLAFDAAHITGLIGHNGSGKSTLLKLLAGQMTSTSGEIKYAGQRLDEWSRRELARSIAYLPQTPPATRGLLVRELVALGRYPWHGAFGRFSKTDADKTAEAMRLTDITHLADRLVDTLSGGERQRAWIAMMVAQDAKCLLLDEPTSALDVSHQVEVLDLIRELSHARGLAAIVVLHDINMAARYCDRLIALKDGRCVADDRPEALLRPSILQDVYGISMNVMPHPGGNGVLAYVD
ncbi:ATP-binding cassette domain-containing protein [Labrenzia sp. CE80]|uniref:ABC transporter ATP-binding protein n=1 Tax=Labrenzia sp. CE80 TaxID=1788986 RepID=UPI00129B67B8|nr:ATP-binding cassette domain-containing protein [Labrenzia sp. CE80]